jgi:hypothetical protein
LAWQRKGDLPLAYLDCVEDCRGVIERLQSGIKARESERRADAAQCLASDDPRLKPD